MRASGPDNLVGLPLLGPRRDKKPRVIDLDEPLRKLIRRHKVDQGSVSCLALPIKIMA